MSYFREVCVGLSVMEVWVWCGCGCEFCVGVMRV